MLLGSVKGYDIKEISKKKIAGVNLSEELQSIVSKEELTEKMEHALSEGGRVYALYQKKLMAVCYIFSKSSEMYNQKAVELNSILFKDSDVEKENMKNNESKNSETLNEKKKVQILTLTDTFVPEKHRQCIEKFDKVLIEELKETMVLYDFQYVIFKEQKIEQKMYHTPFGTMSGVMMGFCIGILFGIALDDIAIGLCLGVSMAILWGGTFYDSAKRGNEKDRNNNVKSDSESDDDTEN